VKSDGAADLCESGGVQEVWPEKPGRAVSGRDGVRESLHKFCVLSLID
jgi:hypothetical protein